MDYPDPAAQPLAVCRHAQHALSESTQVDTSWDYAPWQQFWFYQPACPSPADQRWPELF